MSSHIHRPHAGNVEPVEGFPGLDDGLIDPETIVFIIALAITGALLFLLVYYVSFTANNLLLRI